MKKRGFGAGRWNGFGGKIKNGEEVELAVKRELKEEVGIIVKQIEKVGVIEFQFQGNPEILEVHLYKTAQFTGKPRESEEMLPKWFDIEEIPFQQMWPDDKYWFPLLLEGKKFKGRFFFDGLDNILQYKLSEVDSV